MNQKLKVLFIHHAPCIRAEKEAFALASRGHRVDLFCSAITFQPKMKEIAGTVRYYKGYDELAALLTAHGGDYDIVHCHNEPNEPATTALDTVSCPVVFDCHDFRGLRQQLQGAEAETERRCFNETAAVIHVSQGMRDMAAQRYSLARDIVLPSFPMLTAVPQKLRDKLDGNHIVYLGGLRDRGWENYEYRNYMPFFQALQEAGVVVHAYPADPNPKLIGNYIAMDKESSLFHLHPRLPYDQLIDEISQYQWGLSGFNFMDVASRHTRSFLNNALPNKLFDYIIGGVCPVVVNCDTAGRWAVKHGVGYHAKGIDDVVRIVTGNSPLPPLKDLGDIDILKRIVDLENLYYELLSS